MNRSGLILILGCIGAAAGIFGLIRYTKHNPPFSEIMLQSDTVRRYYISECGYSTNKEPPVRLDITLPADDSSQIFSAYCTLQDEQRLPLSEYFGQPAVIWTYQLESTPTARAELICTPEGLLIGAMCYDCTGFDRMYPLIT